MERPLFGFYNSEKVGKVLNENFSLVTIVTISYFDVSRVLIDGGSSCDIMYADLFEKIGLNKE